MGSDRVTVARGLFAELQPEDNLFDPDRKTLFINKNKAEEIIYKFGKECFESKGDFANYDEFIKSNNITFY